MYFAIGGVFLIIGVILLMILPKTRYYQYHIDEEEDKEYLACLGRGDSPVTTPLLPDNSYKNVESFSHMMKIHNELLITGYGFTFIYIQTF